MGVILTGRAALRKSSAISFMQRFAADLTLNYGPSDTAGARHGIMSAMQARWQDDLKEQAEEILNLEELAKADFDSIIAKVDRHKSKPSSIYFAAKELGRLLTAQTRELLDFFADGIDGESIFYQTKAGNIRIPRPLINLLGATTPGSLPHILPRDSHDHGLLSRLIFVYASAGESAVPIPPDPSAQEHNIRGELIEHLQRISVDAAGELRFTDRAIAEYEYLYEHTIPTHEFKLNAYAGRRGIHLAKLAGIICLLRGESPYVISIEDVALAHVILSLTENDMDGAYVGLDKSKDARAYTILREVIETMGDAGNDKEVLYSHLSRAGYSDEETTASFERLVRSKRLIPNGSKLHLGTSVGAEKVRLYIEGFKLRLAKG